MRRRCRACARSAKPAGRPVGATLVAFLAGYASIAWLLRYLGSHSLRVFVIYRICLGSLVLILTAEGAIN